MSKKGEKKDETPTKTPVTTTESGPRLPTALSPAGILPPPKQSLLAAKEFAAQLDKFVDGDDIEEHLRVLDDMSELLMVDDTVKYQAILLSMDDSARTEFNAWLKTENLKDEVKGNPEALKKRLLEKFRVRKSLLERMNFVIQPRRKDRRLVVDLLERKRVYDDAHEEMMKNREKLLVEASLQLLSPDDRGDYCNLRQDESKRDLKSLVDFVRRKEEERLRDLKIEPKKKKELMMKKKDEEEPTSYSKKKRVNYDGAERERLMSEGRCFLCHKVGHRAADCPDTKNQDDDDTDDDEAYQEYLATRTKSPTTKKTSDRGSGAKSF